MIRLLAVLALLLVAQPAQAHKLKLFVTQEGAEISGKAYFAGGGAAIGIEGQVLDSQGQTIARLQTDAEGRFRYTPPSDAPVRIQFESGDGHMAEAAIGQISRPPSPSVASDVDLETAIARQLTPLKEQLDRMESRARLSDIVGGIGLIIGLFGAYAWVVSRRGKTS
ncbi:MAG: hypothetical protein AB7G62_01695 [Magnetospirillum sp.]